MLSNPNQISCWWSCFELKFVLFWEIQGRLDGTKQRKMWRDNGECNRRKLNIVRREHFHHYESISINQTHHANDKTQQWTLSCKRIYWKLVSQTLSNQRAKKEPQFLEGQTAAKDSHRYQPSKNPLT